MGYKVKLNMFEGPFELLVYLIENAQMNIYDISIAEITGQYIEYIDEMKKLEVSVASEFMVLAAALIELKSKMLLPRSSASKEGVADEDPRTELVEKLLEYKKFKLLSEMLSEREKETFRMRVKPQEDISVYTNEPDEYLDLDIGQFVKAFDFFLQRKQRLEEMRRDYVDAEKPQVTAEQKMSSIKAYFTEGEKEKADFKELLQPGCDKYDVALTFVVVLELVRRKCLEASQKANFGNIILQWTERRKASGKGAGHD